jgi:KaiC/GvpD/RAD55 family RecA-like ATPase
MDSTPGLVSQLVANAIRVAARIGHILLVLEPEAPRLDRTGIEDEGPSTDSLIEKARAADSNRERNVDTTESEVFSERLADVVTRAWLSQARGRRRTRPDVLALTCRALASASEPESYPVARFAVILALRALYGVAYTNETLASLREVYDDLDQRFRQQARRIRRNPTQHENFLLDLLFLAGRLRRTLAGPNLEAYYQSFSRNSLGVAPGGIRVFGEEQDWPQIYGELPDFPSLMTLAFSQPFAVEGLDEITGGLVPSIQADSGAASGGLISLVVGPPGSGKTTFCLSIATRMAALGSAVTYLTTEESRSAILAKLTGSASKGPVSWWPEFGLTEQAVHRSLNVQKLPPVSLSELTESLKQQYKSVKQHAPSDPALYLVFPRVLVIDSLTALVEEVSKADSEHKTTPALRRRQLAETLNELRSLGVCVLMTASADSFRDEALEYLVDNVFEVGVSHLASPNIHPLRSLYVAKTRLQVSYTGQHVLHLSKERGLVISPSLPTVLSEIKSRFAVPSDPKTRAVVWAPSGHLGQMPLPGIQPAFEPITIRNHGHTLLYGRGSSGKARLGLTLCLEPKVNVEDERWSDYVREYSGRGEYVLEVARRQLEKTRVLVISFLYGNEYYSDIVHQVLLKHFHVGRLRHRRSFVPSRVFSMLDLYPGLIDPETLIAKVRRDLEMAKLAGRPYTSVLVDGVHNLVLQFPLLEKQPLLWPCLYRLFRAEGIDTVSTFTFFKVGSFERRPKFAVDHGDEVVHADTAGGSEHLFFHLLVSSSDHSFVVESPSSDEENVPNRNWVRVKIGSNIDGFGNEPGAFWWDPVSFSSAEAVTG